jgi:hypothetical protein
MSTAVQSFSHIPLAAVRSSRAEARILLLLLLCDISQHRVHAGCRLGSLSASPKLIPEDGSAPGFDIV